MDHLRRRRLEGHPLQVRHKHQSFNKTNRSTPQQDLKDIPASNPVDSPVNVEGNFSEVEHNFNPIFA